MTAANAQTAQPQTAAQAVWRGFRGRCPACGEGRMFRAFLKVADQCPRCGEELHHHRADDFPAYLVIVIVGHILVPIILLVETEIAPRDLGQHDAVAVARAGDDARPAAAGQRRRCRHPVVWRHARLRSSRRSAAADASRAGESSTHTPAASPSSCFSGRPAADPLRQHTPPAARRSWNRPSRSASGWWRRVPWWSRR